MQNLPARQKVVIMAGVLLGLFFSSMNQTVVSTAMPRIIASLGGIDLYSWVFTSFMLTSTTTIPIFGKLSDIYGRKPLYLGGMVVFSIGSVLAGLSQDMTQLIVFRAIQGLGSGGMMAISFTIIGDIFSPAERGKWQGLNSSVFGLSSVIGPLIGGYITDNLSWNWVFYVNLPFGALAFAVIWFGLPWQRSPVKRPVDYFGVMALVGGLVPMLLAFVWGGTEYAWSSPTILGLLAGSASMLIVFVIVEHRAEEPIMPLFLFRHRMFTVSVLATFVAGIAMFATITYMPLFIQGVNSESATESGIVMMPLMVSMMTASTLTGQIMSRTGKYLIPALVGTVVMGFGIFLASQMDVNSSNGEAMRNMVVIGLGLGPTMPVFIIAVQNAMPYRYMGVVTSNVQFFRQIGGTMGVAIMGSVLNNRISTELDTRLPTEVQEQGSSELLGRLENPQVLLDDSALDRVRSMFDEFGASGAALFNDSIEAIRVALAEALGTVFLVGVVASVLAFIVTLFLREQPLRTSQELEAEMAALRGQGSGGDEPGRVLAGDGAPAQPQVGGTPGT